MDVEPNSKSSVNGNANPNNSSSDNIKNNIENTREEMSSAAHELGRRLQPKRIVGDFVDSSSTIQFIKRHPVSLSLIGLGVAFYYIEKSKPVFTNINPKTARESFSEGVEYVKEKAHESVDAAKTKVNSARESMMHAGDQAREMASHGMERGQQMYDANPIVFGAVALAAGIGLGWVLPTTKREQRFMGETSRGFIDKAKQQIKETSQTVVADVKDYVEVATQLG